jgi:hypothetical protein
VLCLLATLLTVKETVVITKGFLTVKGQAKLGEAETNSLS